jgi:hypothetical protein
MFRLISILFLVSPWAMADHSAIDVFSVSDVDRTWSYRSGAFKLLSQNPVFIDGDSQSSSNLGLTEIMITGSRSVVQRCLGDAQKVLQWSRPFRLVIAVPADSYSVEDNGRITTVTISDDNLNSCSLTK